jgi:hypothetical protein
MAVTIIQKEFAFSLAPSLEVRGDFIPVSQQRLQLKLSS